MACTTEFVPDASPTWPMETITLQGGSDTLSLNVEMARTTEQHQFGLMFREALDTDGMLFIFEKESMRYFWMKNTLIPLDIMYFDSEGFIVSTTTMVPCEVDPCTNYSSVLPAKYALEVPAGWVEQQGVTKGWKLILP